MNKKKIVGWLLEYGISVILILLVVIFSFASSNFLSVNSIFTILRQVSIIGIISVGMTYVMLTGGIDLSVGSIAGVSSVTAAMLMLNGVHPVLACCITIIVALIVGALNGFLVTKFKMPSIIATLGMMIGLRGLAYIITDGLPVFGFSNSFGNFAKGSLGFVPYPVILMAVVFLLGTYALEKTTTGRYIYGVGGNEEASNLSGISSTKIKLLAYSTSGLLAGIAGLVLLSRTSSGQPSAGTGYEMDAITAVVLGGISINGGEGRLGLVINGVLIMGVLSTGMIMLNVNDYVQQLLKGIVLIGAVAFSTYSQRFRARLADAN
jgi:ribose/xylose/arabinose/galactoside ABC-type transport system permease subunit